MKTDDDFGNRRGRLFLGMDTRRLIRQFPKRWRIDEQLRTQVQVYDCVFDRLANLVMHIGKSLPPCGVEVEVELQIRNSIGTAYRMTPRFLPLCAYHLFVVEQYTTELDRKQVQEPLFANWGWSES